MSLMIDGLCFDYGKKRVLKSISVDCVPRGSLTALLGPNAAGKSTLFKAVAGILPASEGDVFVGEARLSNIPKVQRLERVCYMPQEFSSHAMLTVFDVILLARKSMKALRVSDSDIEAVSSLLKKFEIQHLADRYISALSGGQQQLVSLCQVLVREADIYLLDEPTSALDLGRQLQVMEVLQEEAAKRNAVFILAIHDLSLAARYTSQSILIESGVLKIYGQTDEVFASHALSQTYGVNIELVKDSQQKLLVSATR